jgi:malate synthase
MYEDFLPASLVEELGKTAVLLDGVPGLKVTPSLPEDFPSLENAEVLGMTVEVYREVEEALRVLLRQRAIDRAFIDATMEGQDEPEIIGVKDASGRIVVGPSGRVFDSRPVTIPDHLVGPQVTLFGPPDSAKMSINAMNALHRKLPGESQLVADLVARSGHVPRWGADSEDSKTPMAADLRRATINLAGCFDGSLSFDDPHNGKHYALAEGGLSKPVKRIPGLALPDGDHLLDGVPMPLHIVELVQHVWLNRTRPEAQVLYIPKLENDEEARYLATLLRVTEEAVKRRHAAFEMQTIRVILVFENPRAIFRIREMAEELYPYFLGGSLGWHDFLASTARLFRHDPEYRIPVKADPNIVIRNIRESHAILVGDLKDSGALKIGGMYGVLYQSGDIKSFSVCMVGYIRDVVTQLKRGLDGFWVAHPDFVRIGIALVQAYREREQDPQSPSLHQLVRDLVPDASEHDALLAFIEGPDIERLPEEDPLYLRAVLASNIGVSSVIANDDPEEVRYNLFQALQYVADWLSGNGCVALPATMKNGAGETVFVRIMDDLATTERSRWEVWAEMSHGRVTPEQFEAILAEEVAFLQAGEDSANKRVEVRWEGEAGRWYPLAVKLVRQLMLDPNPSEFVTELLLPFTFDCVRGAEDPEAAAIRLCPGKYRWA